MWQYIPILVVVGVIVWLLLKLAWVGLFTA